MENPFAIDWDMKKETIIKDDYRDIRRYLGGMLTLLSVATYVFLHFQNRAGMVIGVVIYGLSLVAAIGASAVFSCLREFKKESTLEASWKEYKKLQGLCRKFPKTGEQCRVAVAGILAQQDFLTKWQSSWLIGDLKTLGNTERVAELKTEFRKGGLEQGEEQN